MVEQWIVAPKVEGSSPSFYPMSVINYNFISRKWSQIKSVTIFRFMSKTFFLSNYYLLNEKVWQEGLLIDFLQKKIVDNWVKKFLINSSYLFNERLLFEKIIRFYLDFIIWPLHKISIFEFNNVGGLLFINMFIFFFILFLFFFVFLFFAMF